MNFSALRLERARRSFLREIAIIVAGVLIALVFQEMGRWKRTAGKAEFPRGFPDPRGTRKIQ